MTLRNLTRERALWAMKLLERAERIDEDKIYIVFSDNGGEPVNLLVDGLSSLKKHEDKVWILRSLYHSFERYKEAYERSYEEQRRKGKPLEKKSEEQLFNEWKGKAIGNLSKSLSSKFLENYINTSKRLPQLIATNGLIATVSFLLSKDDLARKQVVVDLTEWLKRAGYGMSGDNERALLSYLLEHSSQSALRAVTMEAMAFAEWLKRMAEVKESEWKRKGTAG